jgi:hypothetical protein
VDRAPLPPHERPWRHPSELGPPGHEPTSTSGRVLIATTATLSLLLIGLLALSMTPGRGDPPVAVGSTTEQPTSRPVALERPTVPMVTPLGDDGWGVTTAVAAAGSRRMAARLPSGDVIDVHIVRHDAESGVTLVSLPTRTEGYELAATSPAPSDTVVVQGAEPMVVPMYDIARLDVAEGTPILDGHGDLVGLCTWDGGAVTVMTVSTMPGSSTTSAPATTSVAITVATTIAPTPPPTTAPPATTTSVPSSTTVATSAATTTVPASTSTVSAGGGATTAPG